MGTADITPELQRLGESIAGAVNEVEAYLAANDDAGAEQYLIAFKELAGQRAHDIVLRLVQERRGMPDWRTFT
jgi:hypothetical protein